MLMGSNKPALNLDDLGVEFDEDSPDFTEEEASGATLTESGSDFLRITKEIGLEIAQADLRRRSGRVYSRLIFSDGSIKLLDITWIKEAHGSRTTKR